MVKSYRLKRKATSHEVAFLLPTNNLPMQIKLLKKHKEH